MEEKKLIANTSRYTAYGRTGQGGRSENQDCYGGLMNDNDNLILTVCDGMGGAAGGQTASRLAVESIIKTLMDITATANIPEMIKNAIENANDAIYQTALNDASLRGMGTTATVMVINEEAAWLTHVGDSRIYRLHDGVKMYRTFDHSKVFDMVKDGIITEEQARQSSFSNIITRALGIRKQVEMEVVKIPYKKGDRMILCCDGVWNTFPEPEMLKLFNTHKSAEEEVMFLTDTVNNHGKEHGNCHDNLTAIIADMKMNSTYQYSAWHDIKKKINSFFKRLKHR